ncbi:MAG TPA: hypothetical protein VFW96_10790 [Thermomicrobiales bacterium]|nr:hypothetical protein [Thermomicrobiales bacterium]
MNRYRDPDPPDEPDFWDVLDENDALRWEDLAARRPARATAGDAAATRPPALPPATAPARRRAGRGRPDPHRRAG